MIMPIHDGLTLSSLAVFMRSHALRVPRITLNTLMPWNPNWAKGELSIVYRGLPHGSRKNFGYKKEYRERK